MLCPRANYKLHALRRIRKYLTLEKSKLLYNAFLNNQFKNISIILIFCRKQDYLEVEEIHYKALKIVYNSNEELLISNNEVSIHQKQLRALATDIYKSLADANPDSMKNYFSIKEIPYKLKKWQCFKNTTNTFHLLWNK